MQKTQVNSQERDALSQLHLVDNSECEAHSSDTLTKFVQQYNAEQIQQEQQATIHALYRQNTSDEIAILKSKLEAEKRFNAELQDQAKQDAIDLNRAAKAVENGVKIASQTTALNNTIASLQSQLKTAHEKVRELNQLNPKKLKEQIKRQSEANEKAQGRNKKLEIEKKELKAEVKVLRDQRNIAVNKVAELQHKLEHNTGAGLYHNGEHHLIIWPQKTKMQREDGTQFESRSLLYLHQSGRGGLISHDPKNGAQLCAAPKGGLRPSKDTLDFAQIWLRQVNEVQNGIITDANMIPVNFNAQLQPAE
ncbi:MULTISPECIES: hypothetical protein [unclassified Pseudoalteromonas]|uniref:hypothetical protein n=1 Tax=unclassified Pseudoalteromonas TaxID=194690 RepID=UPI0015FCBC88|nr:MULTISPECIES: hypothetical protein [unclassified Pseudoalteromonas]MBB1290988.1 hypothetical protein [Pseudoalteromonas sp. SR41-5]MBB1415310.1 hypothetical protein [Pseudoalteromonas sp. SG43-8]